MAVEVQYDRAIRLVDTTTKAASNSQPESPDEHDSPEIEVSRTITGRSSKKGRDRAESLRKHWTRNKYARYQGGRLPEDEDNASSSDVDDGENNSKQRYSGKKLIDGKPSHTGRLRGKISSRTKKSLKSRKEVNEIDVLYENQRGLFLCGIPLYSSKSLLNFDPSPWQTAEFQDSPVNITNAQVPDPTWIWAWKSWYVDMSRDVDEEGWEYSFSFNKRFSWHGSQPWLYSYVRRRRWLRKRIRRSLANPTDIKGSVHEAHQLNQDYFTIHSAAREESWGSSIERTANMSSIYADTAVGEDSDSGLDEMEISNVTVLLKTLKKTTVDRKKLDAVRNLLAHGGDELYYLPDAMPEIMGLFMYHNSRRQLVVELEHAIDCATGTGSDGIDKSQNLTGDCLVESNRASGLRRALASVGEYVKEQEYWSDLKATVSPVDGLDSPTSPTPIGTIANALDLEPEPEPRSPIRASNEAGAAIKGIPGGADVGRDTGLLGRLGLGARPEGVHNKGKETGSKAGTSEKSDSLD